MQRKYLQIYEQLAEAIRDGLYPPGSLLPSEHALCEKYTTSRETIRKALTHLSEHGYIQKQQGRGSIVLDQTKLQFPVSGLVSFQELAQGLGENAVTHVLDLQVLKTVPEHLLSQLDQPDDTFVWKLWRVREVDGERIIFDRDYILYDIAPGLTYSIAENSVYQYLEHKLNLTISFAKKEITVEEPDEHDRKYLDIDGFSNIVVVRNFVYLEDTTLFQYTESRHRPDRFRFVDFARRRASDAN
ncbi:GntR family trehalose operon transcriptional repressor [Salsuginibacillus halophilus]|uniref:Trehalose operon repressor n=1 Tax=Salsuginibacillus halophilus TaxID=517424 RepID=A0A2P8HXC4_9BACI|nr:trehalose operon repressor [Salsuginibacillus halophilus]PSL50880.1 GntR family trehalose operon transcriptional repressor [Salsuginibacillus halophilus]